MADAAPVLLWEAGPDKLCNYFNKTWLDFTGRTLEQEMGNGWAEGVHPDDIARCLETYVGSVDARRKFEMEYRLRGHDGEYRWILDRGVPRQNADGTFAGYIGSCIDITERKQMEATLRTTQKQLAIAMDQAHLTYWEMDAATSTFTFNDRFYALYRTTAEREGGYRMAAEVYAREFLPAEEQHVVPDDVAKLLSGEIDELRQEHRILRRDGEFRDIHVHVTVVRDSSGHVVGTRGTNQDITERKRAEKECGEREKLIQQLQKSESLGRMAGAIAHHFNNQLQAVMLNLEVATDNLTERERPVEGLIHAMQSARKAAEVSTLMLTYLGQAHVKDTPLDLAGVCRQSLALLRSAMPRDVVLEIDLPTPGPVISANANQLRQVMTNLMTNAWEASGEGPGSIRLSVKTVSAADIPAAGRFPINWQPQDNATAYACLEIADAGCGMAANDFDKLFDPFFSTKFTGRGLGLPVVLGIVRSHDGGVTVESEPSRGSTFRVFIPVSASALPQKPVLVRESPTSKSVRRGATVLVVEDETVVRTTLAFVLECSGFTVLEAEDGVAAVELFRRHRDEIGCVVCDLTMPRMNGWGTLAALRQLMPGIGFILASGYSEAEVMAGDHPERPQAFLQKPYEAKVLINAINQILIHSNT